MRRVLFFAVLLFALPAGAINWVLIGDPGNVADTEVMQDGTTGYGSVPYSYYISKYEVTNAQYAKFLNAKAASDPLGLYNAQMGFDPDFGGIVQGGEYGSYIYRVREGFANKPVTYVDFYDVLRFANWLNNGQGSGDTETGAYTLLGGTAIPSNGTMVTRNSGAITFLTSENEWYKAAYYDAASASFFDYPTGTNTQTGCVAPGAESGNSANCDAAVQALTDVGAYALSESPYGTFDQGGNVREWNEQRVAGTGAPRGNRGGSWFEVAGRLAASNRTSLASTNGASTPVIGFRVASLVPEPGTALLLMTGLLGLATRRKGRA